MEIELSGILLEFALLFTGIAALSLFFKQIRLPIVLAPVLLGVFLRYTPLEAHLGEEDFRFALGILANLGVLFLLFYIGLQIDLNALKKFGKPILRLTLYSIIFPFIFGFLLIWGLGYGVVLALIIGMTRIPVAEAVVVPILDEFGLMKTKVGQFILGPGVLDDAIEVLLVAIVSIWLSRQTGIAADTNAGLMLLVNIFLFLAGVWIFYRHLIPYLGKWVDHNARNVVIFSVAILFLFSGVAEYSELGLVIGALLAGMALKPWFVSLEDVGVQVMHAFQLIAYGFFGMFFFYQVGLMVEPEGIFLHPFLVIGLFLAGTLGKLLSALLMVPEKSLTLKEAITVGVGLDVHMTTELIIAQMLLSAGVINATLYTVLIAVSSLSMISVPVLLSILLRLWGPILKESQASAEHIKGESWHKHI
jgi:Kef-type K+ transport system membrane component KefB